MERTRDVRVFVYAGCDLVFAAMYAALLWIVIPSRHGWVQALAIVLITSVVVAGVAMMVRRPWSWWVAVGGCAVLLLLAVVYIVLSLMSAALLSGVYGSFGRAGALLMLVAAALMIELIALLPALQLKFLLTRAGRRAFGRMPGRSGLAGPVEAV